MAEITKELGRIPVSRGDYQSTTEYYKDNIVQYKRGSYQVVSDSPIIGISPTNDKNVVNPGWTLFAGTLDAQDIVNQIKEQEAKSIQAVADREAEILAKSDAAEVSFNNIGTSLNGTNVQNVLEETDGKLSELESEVIYDVTANNDGTTFSSLSALLSSENLSTLIPTSVRHGGMSIRFVQSSDNKYVQFRLMADSFSNIASSWQGIDDVPIVGSDNLVKSGGVIELVYDAISLKVDKNVVVTSGGQFLVNLKNADDIKIILNSATTATFASDDFLYLIYPHSGKSIGLPAFVNSELTYNATSYNKGYLCSLNIRPNKVLTSGKIILEIVTDINKNYANLINRASAIEESVKAIQETNIPGIEGNITLLESKLQEYQTKTTAKIEKQEKSELVYRETGILLTPANYYTMITTLNPSKKYALAITTSVSGEMTIQAGTGQSVSDMKDTISTETFIAGQEKFVLDYTPTGSYDYFRLSIANNYVLKLYEYVNEEQTQHGANDINILKKCFLDEYDINDTCVVPLTGWKIRMLDGNTGDISTSTKYINKSIHCDFFKMSGKGKIVVRDGYQFRLYTYNSNKEFESYTYYTSTILLDFDGTKYYKICLFNGTALSPASANNIVLDECTNISLFNVTKINSESFYKTRGCVYGIRIDNSLENNNVTRIGDAVGLNNDFVVGSSFQLNNGMNDFDHIFPWCEMKLCNVKIVDGIKVVTYQGEQGFTRDGSNGDVMVEIPKFYSMRIINGNTEDILISGQRYSGFEVEPVFIGSNGKELNYVYCGAYLTHVENGGLTSKSGELPTTNLSLAQYRQCNGEMYDFAMLQCLQKLMSIEMCALDIQSMLGGLGWLPYNDVKAYENASNVNSAYFYSDEVVDQNYDHMYKVDYLYIGECISITNSLGVVENRKITQLGEIEFYQEGSTNRHRRLVTFSGTPVNLTADITLLTGHGQESGMSDNLIYHTGRAGINNYATVDQFKYRNIEGLWGNCGEYIDGIRVKNAEYYITFDQSKYANIANYTKLSFNAINCVDTTHKYNWKYIVIKRMGYDRRFPNINLPISVTGNAAVLPVYYSCNACVFNDVDYDNQSVIDVEFVGISSLAWDAGRFNGPYTYRFWQREDDTQWLYSTRMIYRSL